MIGRLGGIRVRSWTCFYSISMPFLFQNYFGEPVTL
jgi:hypothetical protein